MGRWFVKAEFQMSGIDQWDSEWWFVKAKFQISGTDQGTSEWWFVKAEFHMSDVCDCAFIWAVVDSGRFRVRLANLCWVTKRVVGHTLI